MKYTLEQEAVFDAAFIHAARLACGTRRERGIAKEIAEGLGHFGKRLQAETIRETWQRRRMT